MQAGYRRDPAESAKALKSKLKAKRRDSILYGAVIKQQSALSTIGNAPIPPSTPGAPNVPSAPVGLPSIGSSQSGSQPSNEKLGNYERQYKLGGIDAKIIQEQLAKLKKNQDMIARAPILTKQQELEAMAKTQKANLKPIDSRKPSVGINAIPQTSTVASQSDIGEVSPMIPSAAPTITASANHPETEGLAKDLLERVNEIREREGIESNKQVTITAYAYDGSDTGARFIVRKETKKGDDTYRFQVTPQSTSYEAKALTKNDQGIDIPGSLRRALSKVSDGGYNAKAATASVNGLGFNESDPTKISSSRIAWMNSRDSGRKLPKGMIYVMGPSLLKGDLRVYSKSGKAVMSASKISPAFQRIVRDTIDRNTFDPQDYSTIEPSESADVNHFISISKPIAPSGIDRLANADGIWKLKKRYEVLVGELSAGNDGSLVRQEMEAILRSLMRMHAINPAKAKDLIKALHDY